MTFGNDTWTDTITERIGTAITAANLLPASAVIDYAGDIDDLLGTTPGDRFVVIAPMNLPVNLNQAIGGGDEYTAFDGIYRVDICLRVMEREKRTARILSDSSKSLATLVLNILKALHIKPLDDSSENSCLRQPLRLVSATYNPRKPAAGWAYCRTVWQTYFITDLRG